ncbi:MAG TPA: nucleoside-diphosphate sugar epimerase/dehydratase, partial [Planctomycetota bacterium]|nr:nucleoside-diphosphate sugar epimerase/dehydratase [Planctomycetota bacterium]
RIPDPLRSRFAELAARWARRLTGGRPHLLVAGATLAWCSAAWFFAYLLRFEFAIPAHLHEPVAWTLPFVLLVSCVSFQLNGVYRILWPYAGVREAFIILRGVGCAAAALYVLNAVLLPPGIVPRSVLLLHAILTQGGVCGLYLILRSLRESRLRSESAATHAVIVGAGDSGDSLLREIERSGPATLEVVGFIDDDPDKQGGMLRGLPVLGGVDDARSIVRAHGVKQAIIAVPSASGIVLRAMVRPLLEAGLSIKVLPSLLRLAPTAPLLPQLKDVAIEDLLRREPVRLDEARIESVLRGKSVLVTGAAGSIGSELCRQVLRYGPAQLVALDWAETPLHDLMLELRSGEHHQVVFPELGDVTDAVRVRTVFADHEPDVVFHAAALKHVPVCEDHPREAIRVNVGGTKTVAEQAAISGTNLFVMISTDKAVNPSSVMGSTKRAAELVIQALHGEAPFTRYAAVRFGNVLGSNGSVLNIFRGQLERGEPLTVTHPEMRRFFMTIPEAVQLVLQAAVQGEGGDVLELDMGAPVKIVDLAEDFIRLSGLRPGKDVKIKFTGVRPGEKLFEELYLNSETVTPTSHPKVFRLKSGDKSVPDPAVRLCLDRLGPIDAVSDPVLARLKEDFEDMINLPERTTAK